MMPLPLAMMIRYKGRGVKLASGGEAVMDATSNRATNAGISRGAGAALRGIKFRGVK